MEASRAAAVVLLSALASCVKPLHFVPDTDASADETNADVQDVREVRDVSATLDAVDAVDAPATEVVSPDVADVLDGGGWTFAVSPSCPTPTGAECARVAVEASASFSLGTTDVGEVNASPVQNNVHVGAFVIDATEVTVARYRRFELDISSRGTLTPVEVLYPNGTTVVVDVASLSVRVREGPDCTYTPVEGPHEAHPVNCVTRAAAMAFCAWDGGRLPTEAEREWVARWWRNTGAPRRYPWGGALPVGAAACAYANVSPFACGGADGLKTVHVGSLPMGAFRGVFELSGNVAEYVADSYTAYGTSPCWVAASYDNPLCQGSNGRGLRGGGYSSLRSMAADPFLTVSRETVAEGAQPTGAGFRCVRAP